MHCTYYQKTKSLWFGLERPIAHAPIGVQLNPLAYSMQQQISVNFIQIGRHLGEWRRKNLFLIHNRGRLCLYDTAVKNDRRPMADYQCFQVIVIIEVCHACNIN